MKKINTKVSILLFFLIVIIFGYFAFTTYSNKQKYKDWQTFNNLTYNYNFSAPKDFSSLNNPFQLDINELTSLEVSTYEYELYGKVFKINILDTDLDYWSDEYIDKYDDDLETVANRIWQEKDKLSQDSERFKVTDIKKTKFKGKQAFTFTLTTESIDTNGTWPSYIAIDTYIITRNDDKNIIISYPSEEEPFKHIVETFEFTNN